MAHTIKSLSAEEIRHSFLPFSLSQLPQRGKVIYLSHGVASDDIFGFELACFRARLALLSESPIGQGSRVFLCWALTHSWGSHSLLSAVGASKGNPWSRQKVYQVLKYDLLVSVWLHCGSKFWEGKGFDCCLRESQKAASPWVILNVYLPIHMMIGWLSHGSNHVRLNIANIVNHEKGWDWGCRPYSCWYIPIDGIYR